jgi:hypothetical protein
MLLLACLLLKVWWVPAICVGQNYSLSNALQQQERHAIITRNIKCCMRSHLISSQLFQLAQPPTQIISANSLSNVKTIRSKPRGVRVGNSRTLDLPRQVFHVNRVPVEGERERGRGGREEEDGAVLIFSRCELKDCELRRISSYNMGGWAMLWLWLVRSGRRFQGYLQANTDDQQTVFSVIFLFCFTTQHPARASIIG